MKIAVLQHAACEGPGDIGRWAEKGGHAVTIHHIYQGDALPAPDAFDWLVVMGGEMNIYQYRDYPWLQAESQLIARALGEGRRAVGICLGAQLIADALGARVTQNPVHELGWLPLRFTAEARNFCPELPDAPTVFHWHGDTFALPPGATRLAASAGCAEQGYVIPGRCLGLQFHLEMDPDLVRLIVADANPANWPRSPHVQTPADILAHAATHHTTNRRMLFALLDRFAAS